MSSATHSFSIGLLAILPLFGANPAAAEASPDASAPLGPYPIFTAHDRPGGISVPLPSLIVTKRGTAVAVAELRMPSPAGFDDFGHESDIIIRRSMDGGLSWQPVQTVFADPKVNAVNGPIVEDGASGRLILTFTEVPFQARWQSDWVKAMTEMGGSVWTITSRDDGRTWSAPAESKPAGPDGWVAWANNCSHGIQLPGGRLVIGGFAHRRRPGDRFRALDMNACLLLSDDHGKTWSIGAIAPYLTDELALALCPDGSILATIRFNNRTPPDLVRLMARSRDRGESFSDCVLQDNMSVTACHAGMIQFADTSRGAARSLLAYCGPQGGRASGGTHLDRTRLTVRLSYDGGRSWPLARLLLPDGVVAEYSDLAIAPDGTILCLYSSYQHSPEGRVDLLRFSLASIEEIYAPLRRASN